MRSLRLTVLLFALIAIVSAQAVSAQDGTLAFSWELTIKPGSAPAFEAAWKEHIALREANGENWSLTVYEEVFGDTPGNYIIRSNNHSWEDMDSRTAMAFNELFDAHVGATISPLIESYVTRVDVTDNDLTRLPDDPNGSNLFAVSILNLKMSGIPGVEAAMAGYHEAMVATDNPSRYVTLRPVFGGPAPSLTLVGLSPDFAGLADPNPSVEQAMVQHHGAERAQELLEGFLGGVESIDTRLLTIRRDLSLVVN